MDTSTAPVALYDLAPLVPLVLLGLLVALVPLTWVLLRMRGAPLASRMRSLTLVTLFLTFDLVLFGAFTRLTDSGLGCPDWPGCYGQTSPIGAVAQISAEQAALPRGPVTHQKAWIEMVHRYAASAVGMLILALAAGSWLQRKRLGTSPWWPTLTLAWVCLQGAFGALTVTMKLFPAIVTMHLLGGMVLLVLLRKQAQLYGSLDVQKQNHSQIKTQTQIQTKTTQTVLTAAQQVFELPRPLRKLLLLGFALLWLQIALGGWVSTNYAVLVCNTFPMCQGQWLPPMQFQEGFALWRPLGQTAAGAAISMQALTAIHVVHRVSAFVVFAVLGAAAWQLHLHRPLKKSAGLIAGLLLWQLVTGLSNVVLGWPLLAAVSHTGGAAGLVVVLTGVWCSTRAAARSSSTAASGFKLGAASAHHS